jgi:hypothetical protein
MPPKYERLIRCARCKTFRISRPNTKDCELEKDGIGWCAECVRAYNESFRGKVNLRS